MEKEAIKLLKRLSSQWPETDNFPESMGVEGELDSGPLNAAIHNVLSESDGKPTRSQIVKEIIQQSTSVGQAFVLYGAYVSMTGE